MLDEGVARYSDVKFLRRMWPGFRAEKRLFKSYVSWSVDGFVWHGDPAPLDVDPQQLFQPKQRVMVGTMRIGSWRAV